MNNSEKFSYKKGLLRAEGEIGICKVVCFSPNHSLSIPDLEISEIEKVIADSFTEFCLDSGYTIAKKIWSKRYGHPTKILKDFWAPGIDHYIWHVKFPLHK